MQVEKTSLFGVCGGPGIPPLWWVRFNFVFVMNLARIAFQSPELGHYIITEVRRSRQANLKLDTLAYLFVHYTYHALPMRFDY